MHYSFLRACNHYSNKRNIFLEKVVYIEQLIEIGTIDRQNTLFMNYYFFG